MIKVALKIMPRKEVLDSSGRAVLSLLKSRNVPVSDCRCGKYVELCIDETDTARALSIAKKAAEDILHNPLVETFELEIIKESADTRPAALPRTDSV